MPEYRVTYTIVAATPRDAIDANGNILSQHISRVYGPRPRKKYYIQCDNKAVTKHKSFQYGKTAALKQIEFFKGQDKYAGFNHTYKLVEA